MLTKRPDPSAGMAEKRIVTPAALLSALLSGLCLCAHASAESTVNGALSNVGASASAVVDTTGAGAQSRADPAGQAAEATVKTDVGTVASSNTGADAGAPAQGTAPLPTESAATRTVSAGAGGAVTRASAPVSHATSGARSIAATTTAGITQTVAAVSKPATATMDAALNVVANVRSQAAATIATPRLQLSLQAVRPLASASQLALEQRSPGARRLLAGAGGGPRVPPGGAGGLRYGAQARAAGEAHAGAGLTSAAPEVAPPRPSPAWRSSDLPNGSHRVRATVPRPWAGAEVTTPAGAGRGSGPPPVRSGPSPAQSPGGTSGNSAGAAGGAVGVALGLALALLGLKPSATRRLAHASAPLRAAPFRLIPERPG
jgi:DNA segregation ATPase FtsK/SpoIIIE, S-DNA-T family